MGVYEVTQEGYETIMGTNPSWFSTSGPAMDTEILNMRLFPELKDSAGFVKTAFDRMGKDIPETIRGVHAPGLRCQDRLLVVGAAAHAEAGGFETDGGGVEAGLDASGMEPLSHGALEAGAAFYARLVPAFFKLQVPHDA